MSQIELDGSNYDAFDMQPAEGGVPLTSDRLNLDTRPTLGTSSRTVITTHKKQWIISFRQISVAQRAALKTTMDKNTFTFTPLPYDATQYTVKKFKYGVPGFRPNSTTVFDWVGIVLEVD